MVRGGSSPLGRTGKAPLAGAFLISADARLVVPKRVRAERIVHDHTRQPRDGPSGVCAQPRFGSSVGGVDDRCSVGSPLSVVSDRPAIRSAPWVRGGQSVTGRISHFLPAREHRPATTLAAGTAFHCRPSGTCVRSVYGTGGAQAGSWRQLSTCWRPRHPGEAAMLQRGLTCCPQPATG
jgi:hypothetical protein